MILLRLHLRSLAAAWIVFQAATLSALVPRACCLAHEAALTTAASQCHENAPASHCSGRQADDPPCAMHDAHHHGEAPVKPSEPGGHDCALRGTCGGPAAALFALLSTHGVLTDAVFTSSEFHRVAFALSSTEHLIPPFAPPDAPPPRA